MTCVWMRVLLPFLQAMVESLLKEFPNVLTLRVRMPIVESLTYERNFITKIIKYEKVCAWVVVLAAHVGGFGLAQVTWQPSDTLWTVSTAGARCCMLRQARVWIVW